MHASPSILEPHAPQQSVAEGKREMMEKVHLLLSCLRSEVIHITPANPPLERASLPWSKERGKYGPAVVPERCVGVSAVPVSLECCISQVTKSQWVLFSVAETTVSLLWVEEGLASWASTYLFVTWKHISRQLSQSQQSWGQQGGCQSLCWEYSCGPCAHRNWHALPPQNRLLSTACFS